MKRYVCILVGLATVFLFGPDFVSAEGPSVRWQKTFGGTENEYGYSVQQTIDGGYIIAGLTTSFGSGSCDVYLVKTDPNGDVVWEKTFGGHDCEKGRSVQQTLDGGYIIAGQDYVGGVYDDAYLIKTDPNGDMVWEKTYGGDMEEWIYSVQQTTDGGYVIAGETHSYGAGAWDVYVIKTDPNGESEWQKTFGGSIVDSGWCVRQTLDGGYIIVGRAYSFGAGSSDVYLIKTDPNGDSQWEKTFGGIYEDSGYSVQQTSDGGYIVTGSAYTPDLVS